MGGLDFPHHIISSPLRDDTGFQREAVLWDGSVLQHADESLRCDRDLVLAALETHPQALHYAHPSLQGDREVVLAAMQSRGWGQHTTLRCAASHLLKDEEVVLAGVRRDRCMFAGADPSFKTNRDFVLQCVKLNGSALQHAHPSVRSDTEVQLAAVAQDPCALGYCDYSIRSNRDVVLAALRKSGKTLQYASHNLCRDREVVLAAVK